MKLVILDVPLDSEMVSPDQNLEDGESILTRAVEVKNLYRVLKGMLYSLAVPQSPPPRLASIRSHVMNLSQTRTKEYNEKEVRKTNKNSLLCSS